MKERIKSVCELMGSAAGKGSKLAESEKIYELRGDRFSAL